MLFFCQKQDDPEFRNRINYLEEDRKELANAFTIN